MKDFSMLKNRNVYLNKLVSFLGTEPVKVITGIRRCGKSSLLLLLQKYLLDKGIDEEQIVFVNFESLIFQNMDWQSFYNYVRDKVVKGRRMYLLFDEVQLLEGWQKVINSFRVDFDCDIYVTGSNAFLLSSQLATYLSGRYVEIKVLPLSFAEFLDFRGYCVEKYDTPLGKKKLRVKDDAGEVVELQDLFEAYMLFGGLPGLIDCGFNQEKSFAFLDGIYSAVIVRDILERGRNAGERQVTDVVLLRKIVMFLADNIGNSVSLTSISNTLSNEKLVVGQDKKPAVQTVQAYVKALLDAFVFYEIKRFDIKGKDYLRTLSKFYIVDVGLRSYLLGHRGRDRGHILENIVYFELLRRGYDVAVGKLDNKEIDFVIVKNGAKQYLQIAEQVDDEDTLKREIAPLQAIKDNCPKKIITLKTSSFVTEDGIAIENVLEFLMQNEVFVHSS